MSWKRFAASGFTPAKQRQATLSGHLHSLSLTRCWPGVLLLVLLTVPANHIPSSAGRLRRRHPTHHQRTGFSQGRRPEDGVSGHASRVGRERRHRRGRPRAPHLQHPGVGGHKNTREDARRPRSVAADRQMDGRQPAPGGVRVRMCVFVCLCGCMFAVLPIVCSARNPSSPTPPTCRQQICTARSPLCGQCLNRELCPVGRQWKPRKAGSKPRSIRRSTSPSPRPKVVAAQPKQEPTK